MYMKGFTHLEIDDGIQSISTKFNSLSLSLSLKLQIIIFLYM